MRIKFKSNGNLAETSITTESGEAIPAKEAIFTITAEDQGELVLYIDHAAIDLEIECTGRLSEESKQKIAIWQKLIDEDTAGHDNPAKDRHN